MLRGLEAFSTLLEHFMWRDHASTGLLEYTDLQGLLGLHETRTGMIGLWLAEAGLVDRLSAAVWHW